MRSAVLIALLIPAHAAAITGFPDASTLVSPTLQMEAVRTAGVLSAQRPYEPATPLGTSPGLDIGVSATVMRIPDQFSTALKDAGIATPSTPILPMAGIQIHKGLGSRMDVGFSYIGYLKYSVFGYDAKVAVFVPEEGPTVAIRVCHTSASLDYVKTKAWSGQILMSRRLDFADPYLGIEYTAITGKIQAEVEPVPGFKQSLLYENIKAWGASAFLGVGMTVVPVGLKFTLEGSYSLVGGHTLGTKIGFNW